MDSLGSLTFVADNVPDWIIKLDDLTEQIANRHSELTQLSGRALKPKNGSTESLRPKAQDAEGEGPLVTEPSPLSAGARQHYVQQMQRRKRKPDSVISNMEPTKYRTRSMIIVYYDSAVQEAFEGIVRNIGTARNNIRKGRMAAKMKQMTSLPDDVMDLGDAGFRSKLAYTRVSRSRGGEEKTPYDHIDLALETAQSLCEHGAHQFLRDGDCAAEIHGIRVRLEEAAGLAGKEADKLKEQEAKEAKETERKAEEEEEEEEEEDGPKGTGDGPVEVDTEEPTDSPPSDRPLEVDPNL
ncbi:MAG: hypothetical protein M1833_001965 [Piccolia ochrophora]|nr:MAG: hypothetical protein M1833_001965 [Piccolia ochrophora]